MNGDVFAEQLSKVLQELSGKIELKPGQIFVLGCSTSEVLGHHIGKGSSVDVAKALHGPLIQFAEQHKLYLAVQCCEHLNRALVVSRECQERYGLTEVNAIPQPGAGGSMAAVTWVRSSEPVLVESIQAHAGLDIGDAFIGMHLRPVAVPVRTTIKQIGQAHVTAAKTRPRLIGGERAIYKQTEGVLKTCL